MSNFGLKIEEKRVFKCVPLLTQLRLTVFTNHHDMQCEDRPTSNR